MAINKKKLWKIINPDHEGNKLSKYFDVFILILIVLNAIAVILSTIHQVELLWRIPLY